MRVLLLSRSISVGRVRVDDIRWRCRCDVSTFSLLCVELRKSIVDVSTFEDPIDVKLAMLLHLPGRRSRIRSVWILLFNMLLYSCTRITPRVCTLVLFIIIVIFAENASFTCKLRRHLLALMALTTPKPQNTDTNGIHATWAWHYYSRF